MSELQQECDGNLFQICGVGIGGDHEPNRDSKFNKGVKLSIHTLSLLPQSTHCLQPIAHYLRITLTLSHNSNIKFPPLHHSTTPSHADHQFATNPLALKHSYHWASFAHMHPNTKQDPQQSRARRRRCQNHFRTQRVR